MGLSSALFIRISVRCPPGQESTVSFDNSRFTFNPRNDYSGVVMQQGRVQLDSDWNEWLAELARRIQAGTLDILGRAVYPATTPHAFEITASSPGGTNTLLIGPGPHVCRWTAGGEPRRSGSGAVGPGAGRNVGRAAAAARLSDNRRNRLHPAALHAAEHHAARGQRAVPGVSRCVDQAGRLHQRSRT